MIKLPLYLALVEASEQVFVLVPSTAKSYVKNGPLTLRGPW